MIAMGRTLSGPFLFSPAAHLAHLSIWRITMNMAQLGKSDVEAMVIRNASPTMALIRTITSRGPKEVELLKLSVSTTREAATAIILDVFA
jgi:hypothetical protein